MLTAIISAILAVRQLAKQTGAHALIPERYAQIIRAGDGLYTSIKAGVTVIRHDDGTAVTGEEFDQAFAAAEAQQHATSAGAAGRIEDRHQEPVD